MNINKEKFDTSMPCNMDPFAFVEKESKVNMSKAGSLSVISFGAMDYNNHYSPEFGGVALVNNNPDLFIAVKYIPWDAEARNDEHKRIVDFLESDKNMQANIVGETLFNEFDYTFPTKQEIKRRNYLEQVRRDKNEILQGKKKKVEKVEATKVQDNKVLEDETLDGEKLI